ncbi:hypothetical protein M426DRAFT_262831 [Hypoxylon sp. CI-4A]|nr:hypothetical protein M426DRAFT_262831 [Hypoxylon sp. CI-4A]
MALLLGEIALATPMVVGVTAAMLNVISVRTELWRSAGRQSGMGIDVLTEPTYALVVKNSFSVQPTERVSLGSVAQSKAVAAPPPRRWIAGPVEELQTLPVVSKPLT